MQVESRISAIDSPRVNHLVAMKRINQYQFYQLGMVLHPLSEVTEGRNLQGIAWSLVDAKAWLQWLMSGQLGEISVSWGPARKLLYIRA